MIVYVITDKGETARRGGGFQNHKVTLEDLSGDVCLVLHYTQARLSLLADLRPWAVCHSGGGAEYKDYDVLRRRNYQRVIREWQGAQIGFCGGHQIVAHSFGSTLGHMGKVKSREADHNPGYHAGLYKEWGVYPITVVRSDPIFNGLGKTLRMQEYHMDEVKRLGRDLVLLASSARCRVQVFKHRAKPIYGTQFHPEQSPESSPDGRKLLENFFRIAREYPSGATRE